VCVYILRPADHVFKTRVLATLEEYRTLGPKALGCLTRLLKYTNYKKGYL